MSNRSPAAIVAVIASRRFGIFTRKEARDGGYSSSAIGRMLASGRWIQLHPGIYRDAAVPRCPEQPAVAGWLASGNGAAISHTTAAWRWGLEVEDSTGPHVTVPRTNQSAPDNVEVHRSLYLPRSEIVVVAGLHVTRAARTLLDIAGLVSERDIEIHHDALWRRGVINPERLARYLASPWCRTRPRSDVLRKLVRDRLHSPAPESVLETLFLRIVRRFRLPKPVLQHPVRTPSALRRIDCAYVEQRVAVELDGFETRQADRAGFDDDHLRQIELEALGWRFKRFSWTQCTQQELFVAVTVAEALGLVPSLWRAHRNR